MARGFGGNVSHAQDQRLAFQMQTSLPEVAQLDGECDAIRRIEGYATNVGGWMKVGTGTGVVPATNRPASRKSGKTVRPLRSAPVAPL